MKKASYFTSKALSALKIFKFLSSLFGHVVKQPEVVKLRLISNLVTPHPGYQSILIRILPNILRSKGNQTLKFPQLVEYNIRNIFPEKPYAKCGGESRPRPFSGKLKLRIPVD